MGNFHIINFETYSRRQMDCGPGCDSLCAELDPPEHEQNYGNAICGAEVVRHRDEYCSVHIANPAWNRDWCTGCICRTPWRPDEVRTIRERGILAGMETELAGMEFTARTGEMGEEEQRKCWEEALQRAGREMWDTFTPELANWFRQVREFRAGSGPAPGYWPDGAGTPR